ncbi:MAG: hypothetical protein PHH58_07880 [Rhodoferax sp.]|nr:hypothetical protein [Rhodoferax sp.]
MSTITVMDASCQGKLRTLIVPAIGTSVGNLGQALMVDSIL